MRVVPSACTLAVLIAGFGLYAEAQEGRVIVSADQVQFASIGPIKYLWLKLSIANNTDARVKVVAADVQLEVGEQILSHGLPPQNKELPARRFPSDPLGTLTYLSDRELPPGAAATDWVCFDLSPLNITIDKLDEPASASWVIAAKFAKTIVQFDLKQHENSVSARLSNPFTR